MSVSDISGRLTDVADELESAIETLDSLLDDIEGNLEKIAKLVPPSVLEDLNKLRPDYAVISRLRDGAEAFEHYCGED
jgi:hypothetical protein